MLSYIFATTNNVTEKAFANNAMPAFDAFKNVDGFNTDKQIMDSPGPILI